MWTRLSVSKCGCAFSSVTRPWVAQRVWPMPVVAGGAATATPPPLGVRRALVDGGAQRAQVADGAHRIELRPSHCSEMPAES